MSNLENQPSIKKMQDDMNAFRLISWLLPKKQREQFKKIKSQMDDLIQIMTKYNTYFSDFGWCAYDSLSVTLMKDAIDAFENNGINAAEEIIIRYYTSDVKNVIPWLKGKSKEFGLRYDLIEKAFADHFAERYYASVPLFLIIIDGAVNDFTGSKGFSADGTNIEVWDCLVGADNGLTKVRKIICEPRKKTNIEMIEIPYRHGILHGRDLNYGNVKVSCKCVALMFAIADWIQMKNSETSRKEKYEKEINPPPIRESLKRISDNKAIQAEISDWKRREVLIGEHVPKNGNAEEYAGYGYLQKLAELFTYWKNRNYGYLSKCFDDLFFLEKEVKKRAGECRSRFSNYNLISWELIEVEERACALTRVKVCAIYEQGGENKTVIGDIFLHYGNLDSKRVSLPWRNDGEWKVTAFHLL